LKDGVRLLLEARKTRRRSGPTPNLAGGKERWGMGYPSTHLRTYKRRLALRERVHPTVLKEVRRVCRRYKLREDSRFVAQVVAEVIRRLHLSFRSD
jgi:hypothetical protein